jgi:hypothetical protein
MGRAYGMFQTMPYALPYLEKEIPFLKSTLERKRVIVASISDQAILGMLYNLVHWFSVLDRLLFLMEPS